MPERLTIVISDAARKAAIDQGIDYFEPYPPGLAEVTGAGLTIDRPGQRVLALGGVHTGAARRGLRVTDTTIDTTDIYRPLFAKDGTSLPLDSALPPYPLTQHRRGRQLPACPTPLDWGAADISTAIYRGTHLRPNMGFVSAGLLLGGTALGALTGYIAHKLAVHPPMTTELATALGASLGFGAGGGGIIVSEPLMALRRAHGSRQAAKQISLSPAYTSEPPDPQSVYLSEPARRAAMNDKTESLSINHADLMALGKLLGNNDAARRLFGNGLLLRDVAELQHEAAQRGAKPRTRYYPLPTEEKSLAWMGLDPEPKEALERYTGTTTVAVTAYTTEAIREAIWRTGRSFGKDIRRWPVLTAMGAGIGAGTSLAYEAFVASDNPLAQHLGAAVLGAGIGLALDTVRTVWRVYKTRQALKRLAPVVVRKYRDDSPPSLPS